MLSNDASQVNEKRRVSLRQDRSWTQFRRRRGLKLLQLGVLGFGLLQDGNVRVCVFPEGEEVLVGFAGCCGITLGEGSSRDLVVRHGEQGRVEE